MEMIFISTIIFSTIEYSNILIALILLGFIAVMVIICVKIAMLLRVQGGVISSGKSSVLNNLQVPRITMTRVHIPFTFKLMESNENSRDEIKFAITSQTNYVLQVYWAVSIRELHAALWRPWNELQQIIKLVNHNTIIDNTQCQLIALNRRQQGSHEERIISIKTPKPPITLGLPPRLAYPLVIFLIKDNSNNELSSPDETVLLINIVHVKDLVCPLPTSLLAQYMKQANGQLSSLKQLYLATGDAISDINQTNYQSASLSLAEPVTCSGTGVTLLCSDGPQIEQLCVVCQYFPLSRALLPCRHTCICAVCFSKLERCPMCRASINSYFCIRSEEYLPSGSVETQPINITKHTIHWLDALNDRLTDFLGFR